MPTPHSSFLFGRIIVATSIFFLLSCIPLVTLAQNSGDIGVEMTPAFIEDQVDPGEGLGGNVTITNVSGGPQTYQLVARDVESVDPEGRASFT